MKRRAFLGAGAAFLAAGCSRSPAPVLPDEPRPTGPAATAPAAAQSSPNPGRHFVIYGDCRSRPQKHAQVARQIARVKPSFVVQTGDLVGGDGTDQKLWQGFDQTIKPLRDLGPYYVVVGNHDRGAKDLPKRYDLPVEQPGDTWYTFVQGTARFIVLDSNELRLPKKGARQLKWLEQQLAAAREPVLLVCLHHPPYCIGAYRPGDLTVRRRVVPLLRRYGVTAVFSAHDHSYYRTRRDNITYIVTAGGGAPLYDQHPELAQAGDVSRKTLHFVDLTLTGDRLSAQVIDDQGQCFDRWELTGRSRPSPAQPATAGAGTTAGRSTR